MNIVAIADWNKRREVFCFRPSKVLGKLPWRIEGIGEKFFLEKEFDLTIELLWGRNKTHHHSIKRPEVEYNRSMRDIHNYYSPGEFHKYGAATDFHANNDFMIQCIFDKLMRFKPDFVLNHIIVEKLTGAAQFHFYKVYLNEALVSFIHHFLVRWKIDWKNMDIDLKYIALFKAKGVTKEERELARWFAVKVLYVKNMMNFFSHVFSESDINEALKEKELEDLFQQCRPLLEENNDNSPIDI